MANNKSSTASAHERLRTDGSAPRVNRRSFIKISGAAAVAAVGVAPLALARPKVAPARAAAGESAVLSLDLSGKTWTLRQQDGGASLAATVPGCNYQTLMEHKLLPDFWYRENIQSVQWVAEKTWIYEREFTVSHAMLAKAHLDLICHGLDTLASVTVNGHHVADTDNMFRTYVLDVKPYLRAGSNSIRVVFSPLESYVRQHQQAYNARYKINLSGARSWVRKAPYMWGWDWCRQLLPAGIWKNIEIVAFDSRLTDLGLLQQHQSDGSVLMNAQINVAGHSAGHTLRVTAYFSNEAVAHGEATVSGGASTVPLVIKEPKLWWPNGMGEHPLYHVTAELRNAHGQIVDTITRRTGLRTIEVLPRGRGEAMQVKINGVPFFVKGADWVPPDNLPSRVHDDTWRWYAQTAADSNFNFIRLWGGGYYEADAMFDACDELGIMLQFEFKFANDTYPVRDKAFINNVSAEFEDNVRRTRNHPSIAIWSGNNEIGHFKGYNYLFKIVIGDIVHKLVPGCFYEVGSGASGSGDIHTWGVWHGQQPFSAYRHIQGFVTEFGLQSFPVPKTVQSYTDAADRSSVHTPVMRYHEEDGSRHGNGIIMRYCHEYFGEEKPAFDDALWLSQIMQAYGVAIGVEHWRRSMPRSMAATIWQFNDCWPGPSWAMIDRYRRFKAIQYHSKHFFAPLLVSPVVNADALELHVVSDRMKDCGGQLSWQITDFEGTKLHAGQHAVHIPARASRLAHHVDCAALIRKQGVGNLLAWTQLRVGSRVVSRNIALFARPRMASLKPVRVKTQIAPAAGGYDVTLSADHVALYAFLDLHQIDATYSDNFVHLQPGKPVVIHVQPAEPLAQPDFSRRLVARSLVDLVNLGAIFLTPDAATLHGSGLRVDNEHGARNIGFWRDPTAYVSWKVAIEKAGRYNVYGKFATPQGSVKLRLTLAGRTIEKPVPKTVGWGKPEVISFGAFEIAQAGEYEFTLHSADVAHWHPVNVLGMTVTPVEH